MLDEYKRTNRNANVLMEPEKLLSYARKSPLAALSEADWLDLWMELQAKAYGCLTIPVPVVKAALDSSTPSERTAFARRWADELRRLPDAGPSSSHVFHALSKDLAAGESYPEEYEDVFTFRGLDADIPGLFAKIAPGHRERVALREIDHLPEIADMVLRVSDLAPRAAAKFKERRGQK